MLVLRAYVYVKIIRHHRAFQWLRWYYTVQALRLGSPIGGIVAQSYTGSYPVVLGMVRTEGPPLDPALLSFLTFRLPGCTGLAQKLPES